MKECIRNIHAAKSQTSVTRLILFITQDIGLMNILASILVNTSFWLVSLYRTLSKDHLKTFWASSD